MLESLRGKATDRKLRLFACAYCRAVRATQGLGPGAAVAVAERYADGLAGEKDLAPQRRGAPFPDNYSEWVLAPSAYDGAWQPVDWLAGSRDLRRIDPDALRHFPLPMDEFVRLAVLLLRDIFGDPSRPVTTSPAWRTAQVVALAQAAYDQREVLAGTLAVPRLAVLAGALEEAGCTEQTILGHLRGPGPHVRGCWAVDLSLGKE
jgi:hypothetical protein